MAAAPVTVFNWSDPAVAYDGREFAYAHLVLAGILIGVWPAFEARTSHGFAASRALAAGGEEIEFSQLKLSLFGFRYSKGLIAAEDFTAWLDARGLDLADLHGHLTREMAADRVAPSAVDPPVPEEVAPLLPGSALCSSMLLLLVATFTKWAAAARGLGDDAPETADASGLIAAARQCIVTGPDAMSEVELVRYANDVALLHAAHEQFAAKVATAERIDRTVASHSLDWHWFRWSEIPFASEPAAREAALLVREDGLGFVDVSEMSGAQLAFHESYFNSIAEDVSGVVMSTPLGELAGPLPIANDESWRLLQVTERIPAHPADPVLREWARNELVDDALERHLVGRVVVHGEL